MSRHPDYGALHQAPHARPAAVDPRRCHRAGDFVELPQQTAANHPLYGIAGWTVVLAVFMILDAIMAVLIAIGTFVVATRGAGGVYAVLGLVHLAMLGWMIACIVKLFSKRADFPGQFTALCIVTAALTVLGALINGFTWFSFIQLAVVAIYIAYLQHSHRIRVTFRHQVGDGDAYLSQLFPEGLPDHLRPAGSPWSTIGKMPAPNSSGAAAARRPF